MPDPVQQKSDQLKVIQSYPELIAAYTQPRLQTRWPSASFLARNPEFGAFLQDFYNVFNEWNTQLETQIRELALRILNDTSAKYLPIPKEEEE